jgi:hypothetical protein
MTHRDPAAWLDATLAVVQARRGVEAQLQLLDRCVVAARAAGATWDELAYVTGQTRSTVRRWAVDASLGTDRARRLAVLRATIPTQGGEVVDLARLDGAAS